MREADHSKPHGSDYDEVKAVQDSKQSREILPVVYHRQLILSRGVEHDAYNLIWHCQ